MYAIVDDNPIKTTGGIEICGKVYTVVLTEIEAARAKKNFEKNNPGKSFKVIIL